MLPNMPPGALDGRNNEGRYKLKEPMTTKISLGEGGESTHNLTKVTLGPKISSV